MRAQGIAVAGGLFPVQSVGGDGLDLVAVHRRLRELGVRAVLRADHGGRMRLSFVLTAGHAGADVDHAMAALTVAARRTARPRGVLAHT